MVSWFTLETLSIVLILVKILSVIPSSALAAGTKLHLLSVAMSVAMIVDKPSQARLGWTKVN